MFYGCVGAQENKADIADCQIIREVEFPLTKKPNVKRTKKLALLNTCLEDDPPQQRPTEEVVRNGKKEFRTFEVLKVFKNKAEAEKYAKDNGITDTKFGDKAETENECRIIRVVDYPVAKKQIFQTEKKIALLELCTLDKTKIARTTVKVTRSGKTEYKMFDVVKVFETRAEAEKYAQENRIFDAEFKDK